MADIPPPSALSSSAAAAAPVAAANSVAIEATLNNVPDKIQQLARQIEISGTLAQPPANNAVVLNTALGPLALLLPQLAQMQQEKLLQQLTALFQNQRPLTVMLQPGNPPTQAFLLLPPPNFTPTQASPGGLNYMQQTGAQAAPPLTPNITLSAVVLPALIAYTPGAGTQTPYANLVSNAGLGFNPAANPGAASDPAAAAPEIAAAQEALAGQEISPGFSTPQGAWANAPPAQGGAALLQPGAELTLQVNAVIPPASQNAALPALARNQILATVAGNAPGGQLILKSGDATLYVRQPGNLPAGTQLLLTVEPGRANAPSLLTIPDQQPFATVQQALAVLMQADPAAAAAIISTRVPQPNPETFPGALLFFLSAIRQGDVRSWLGNGALDLLTRAGKMELIGKLTQELQQSSATVRDNVVGEWKSYMVPVHDNGQMSALYFYVHGDRNPRHGAPQGKGGEREAPKQVRFLIDMRMSRLGAMQLDGFLRPKQLDIIMRSEQKLPPGFDNELRQTYAQALEAIGYTGGLNFQTGRQGWLVMQKTAAGSRAVVT